MKAEIVSVGTELLLGTIVDTNAAFLASELASLGIDCFHISQVGDNTTRISELLSLAAVRSDLVVLTGGMGPTKDDLARESIARLLGEEMVVVPSLERDLREFFARRRVKMPAQNVKQATLIPSAEAIPNPVGTAPGWFVTWRRDIGVVRIVAMPGVPFEMKRMWADEVAPRLRASTDAALVSRTLKVLGPGESLVDATLSDLMEGANPTLAPYAKPDGIHLRLMAKASDRAAAQHLVDELETQVRERLGSAVYGGEGDTPYSVVAARLISLGLSIVLLEVGSGAAGSLSRLAEAGPDVEPMLKGCVSVPAQGALHDIIGSVRPVDRGAPGPEADLATGLASLKEHSRADLALGVEVTQERLPESQAVAAEARITLLIPDSEGSLESVERNQGWRTEASEVPRLVGLASYNLLRLRLINLEATESRK